MGNFYNDVKSSPGMYPFLKLYRLCYQQFTNVNFSFLISEYKLMKFKNKYQDKRCFIIGNGPSLNKTNLSLLENENTFGLNRIYLLSEKLGFKTSFYVCVNKLVLQQFAKDISKLDIPKFISSTGRRYFKEDRNTIFLRGLSEITFSKNAIRGVWHDSTVTYTAMQLAYWMGFSEIVLVGVDHNFAVKGVADKVITSKGPDRSHFSSKYFGKGVKWQLPNLEGSELAYRMAKAQFEREGKRIVNATVGGRLDIFPREKLESFFR